MTLSPNGSGPESPGVPPEDPKPPAKGEGDCVLVPRGLTEPMRRAVWRQQYLFHGATAEEADRLAEAKVADNEQRANDEDGYLALLASSPKSDGWGDIGTAPKNEVVVIVNADRELVDLSSLEDTDWGTTYWALEGDGYVDWKPTHWIALPAVSAPPPSPTDTGRVEP